jgi:hypothetical protein
LRSYFQSSDKKHLTSELCFTEEGTEGIVNGTELDGVGLGTVTAIDGDETISRLAGVRTVETGCPLRFTPETWT